MMYIYASGAFQQPIYDELPSLKEEVKQSCGRHVRRIDRFIQLAMIGSHRCINGQTLAHPCSLYLASSDGCKTNTVSALHQVFVEQQPLMPLNFVNLVSNAAAFYVAQSLDIDGASLFVISTAGAFEKALNMAALDLSDGTTDQALVGIVDECAAPIALQRQLLGVPEPNPVGESSFWLLTGTSAENAIAVIHDNRTVNGWPAVLSWLQQHADDDACIASGADLSAEQHATINALSGRDWSYTDVLPSQHGQTGYAVDAFLNQPQLGKRLLHIGYSSDGLFQLLLLERL